MIVDPWTMPEARRRSFWHWATGEYLGDIDEIADDAQRELLPLECFDNEQLRQRTSLVTEEEADRWATRMTRKACAGRHPEVTATGPQVRAGIKAGKFTEMERGTWYWTLGGIWAEHLYLLYARWRLSIFELARINAVEFDGTLAMSAWLNLWGADPSRPLPDGDGLNRRERARQRGFVVREERLCDARTGQPVEVTDGPWRVPTW